MKSKEKSKQVTGRKQGLFGRDIDRDGSERRNGYPVMKAGKQHKGTKGKRQVV